MFSNQATTGGGLFSKPQTSASGLALGGVAAAGGLQLGQGLGQALGQTATTGGLFGTFLIFFWGVYDVIFVMCHASCNRWRS